MSKPIWLEAALNGAWTRAKQSAIPLSPKEIIEAGIACAREGASILHYHAYDPQTGQQTASVDVNARIIEAIKAAADVIIYPAISPITAVQALTPQAGPLRYEMHQQLARRGLVEWMVIDPGSTNMSSLAEDGGAAGPQGYLYLNTESCLAHAMTLAREQKIRPSYAVYEPGFIRLGAKLAKQYRTLQPIYRLMFSDQFSFGFPPEEFALQAYAEFLKRQVPDAPWMVAGLGVNILHLIPATIALGGHIRVGLEDAHLGSQEPSHVSVRQARQAIEAAGANVASAAQVRAALAGETS